jgi:spore maturation protein CgeB
MDFAVLDAKLKEIKRKRKTIKQEIGQTRESLVTVDRVGGSEWWYSGNFLGNIQQIEGGIHLKLPEHQHIYFSYMEENVKFSLEPKHPIVFSENRVNCEMIGLASETVNATLYVIGYKEHKKTKIYKIPFNSAETIELEPGEIDCFRIAVKVEGTGLFHIESVRLGDKEYEGFQTGYSTKLNLEKVFKQVKKVDSQDIGIPRIYTNYIKKFNQSFYANIPEGSYAYLKSGTGALFELKAAELSWRADSLSYYEIGLSVQTSVNVIFQLILVGYSGGNPVETRLINNYTKAIVKFNEHVDTIHTLFRVQGKGDFSNIMFGIKEHPRKLTIELDLELNKAHWFNPNTSLIKLQNKDNQLYLSSDLRESKPIYLSYKENNNSFSKVPEKSVFEIQNNHLYEFVIKGKVENCGSLVPIIITYSDYEKDAIIPLEWNEVTRIEFKETIKYCRFAFKTTGTVNGKIEQIKIVEFPKIETAGQMEWLDNKEVSLLGMSPIKELKNVKMAAIFDEFTTQCFAHECQLISFTPDNWKEVMISSQPDVLMVESAWRGNNGAWTKKVQQQNDDSIKELKQLIAWCNENRVPTVFWNKEDPVHFNHFIETAKLFDFVFTTDLNMVPVYKEICGHNQVDCLQFAAQPAIHNPITVGDRDAGVCFAGSYYAKHHERTEDMLRIFQAAIPYGLTIFDRNYEKVKIGGLPYNRFPEHLEPYVQGSLNYYEIDRAYKGYQAVMNINTVKDSPTMFARRVFEALASGTPVISNYSEGVEKMFGDIVYTIRSEEELDEAFQSLFNRKDTYRRRVVEGIRRVLKDHTYFIRLQQIIDFLQLPFKVSSRNVVVIGLAESQEAVEKLVAQFNKQTFENKRFILICSNEILENTEPFRSNIIQLITMDKFIKTYQNFTEIEDCDFIAGFNCQYTYDKDHLLDLCLATKYAPWEIITQNHTDKLEFRQIETADLCLSIFKPSLFSVMSAKASIEFLFSDQDFSWLKARGSRILGISTH